MEIKYQWVIAYIDKDHKDSIDSDIEKTEYPDIKYCIPQVRVLKKRFKGKDFYDYIPLMFNYGFFYLPEKLIANREALTQLKRDIGGLFGFIYKELEFDEIEETKHLFKIHTAPEEEVLRLQQLSYQYSIFSAEDLDRIQVGDEITLKVYPFDNLQALILDINKKKEEIKVKLLLETYERDVTVSFENVFYSIYQNFNEAMKERNLEDFMNMGENPGKNTILDSILFKANKHA